MTLRSAACPECGATARPKNLAQAVRWDRRRRGMDVRGYARLIGASGSTISRIERGALPDFNDGLRLAHLLKISVDDLIAETLDKIQTKGGESVGKKKAKTKRARKRRQVQQPATPQPAPQPQA